MPLLQSCLLTNGSKGILFLYPGLSIIKNTSYLRNRISSGQGENPDRRYSPRADI